MELVARFALVAISRVVLVGLMYAFVGFFTPLFSLTVTGLLHPIAFLGFGVMTAAAAAVAGAIVAIASLLIPSFSILLALSFGAALAPAVHVFLTDSSSSSSMPALNFLLCGLLVGWGGAIAARAAGLLAPDPRLGHGVKRVP
jgi:hypothetical protein